MRKVTIYEVSDFPEEVQKLVEKKLANKHYRGNLQISVCDGYFKPLSEVRDMSKIHFFGKETIDKKNVYVYEEGDDPIGDYLLSKGVKIGQDIEIEE